MTDLKKTTTVDVPGPPVTWEVFGEVTDSGVVEVYARKVVPWWRWSTCYEYKRHYLSFDHDEEFVRKWSWRTPDFVDSHCHTIPLAVTREAEALRQQLSNVNDVIINGDEKVKEIMGE